MIIVVIVVIDCPRANLFVIYSDGHRVRTFFGKKKNEIYTSGRVLTLTVRTSRNHHSQNPNIQHFYATFHIPHMLLPLYTLTLGTSCMILYAYIYSQVYMYNIIATLVYEPMLCKLTYVSAHANPHTQNLFVYIHSSTSIHIAYDRYFCI